MPEIRRLFVEKKPPFAVEARKLHQDLRDHLDLAGLEGVRLVVRYDVEGLDGAGLDAARWTVFAEPPVDEVFDEELPLGPGETALAVEYLPGQYDQRADSAALVAPLHDGHAASHRRLHHGLHAARAGKGGVGDKVQGIIWS